MKALTNRPASLMAARVLKVVGLILIVAALLDYIILPIPLNLGDRQWQLGVVTQIVDRGILPMVGMALLFAGLWVDQVADAPVSSQYKWQGVKIGALMLASVLGFVFLVMAPVHINNVRINRQAILERINQEAGQAESQFENRLSAELQQQRGQLEQLIQNEGQLEQAIQQGQVPAQQAELLRQFRQDPKALEDFLAQRSGEFRQQIQTEIGVRRTEAEKAARTEAWKSGLRIGFSSLLLAIGYITIGWTGLKALGGNPAPNRAATR